MPDIQASIIRREELGPTGIGEGVAIPHAWHPTMQRTVGALAVSRRGLDFESLDRMPVYIVVLLLTPPGAAGEQAKTAAFDAVLQKMRDGSFRATSDRHPPPMSLPRSFVQPIRPKSEHI